MLRSLLGLVNRCKIYFGLINARSESFNFRARIGIVGGHIFFPNCLYSTGVLFYLTKHCFCSIDLLCVTHFCIMKASFGTFCVIDFSKPIPRQCRYVPRRRAWKNRRKYKPIVHEVEDDPDDNTAEVEDEEKKIWLESRVSKPAEDEYSTELMSNTATPNAVSDEDIAADRRSCTVCSHYKNMLYTEFLGPKEMIVVEQPWLDVVETFPAALQRRIYGAD